MGERAIIPWRGSSLFVQRTARAKMKKYVQDDLRVRALRYDAAGERRISFVEAVSTFDGVMPADGLGLEGPASALWLCKHIAAQDGSPVAHHE
eukprot:1246150-Amphidinium_carterae.1